MTEQPGLSADDTTSSLVIAIDGPSGTGKSTVARRLAGRLGLRYLDTGAMYRAATWAVLQHGTDPADAEGVAALVEKVVLVSGTDPDHPTITADGVVIDAEIRGADVTAAVSAVSAVPAVRTQLVDEQRAIIGAGGIVVEGRDIGTVVAPDAAVKVFLTASSQARARRRSAQDGNGPGADAATEKSLARRDRLDSTRAVAPLKPAEDAVEVDTTELGIDAVLDRLVDLVGGSVQAR